MMMSIRETGRLACLIVVSLALTGCDSEDSLPRIGPEDNAATLNRVIDVYETWLMESSSFPPQLRSMGDDAFVQTYYERELERYKVLADRIEAEIYNISGMGGVAATYMHDLCMAQQHAIRLWLAGVGSRDDDGQLPYANQIHVNASALEDAVLMYKLRLGRDLGF